ncbi:Thiol-disulfide oxidoreductase ResA [Candidatus Brocadiaceae bacterium B188]|nr:redoxin domain-containing protein [Candidatus Brocadia sapporoensis]QQR68012.1 MAG: redoxin domain-containing protein [Candidatus Brocadia sp.]TWU52878.1 Thiol-disulfide oxidoreductase ResA [Candidatus Brocadiaceae bacterium B188]
MMKKRMCLVFTAMVSVFLLSVGHTGNADELRHDTNAAKQLEIIRKTLSGLTEMKFKDAKKYYEESLKDLNTLIDTYAQTDEALQARFYTGVVHFEMRNFEDAITCFNAVLKQGEIDHNFKARTLYFKAKALLAKGDLTTAKETVAELRQVEPRAADAFGNELSGMVRIGKDAPPFNVTDFNGNVIDLSKYKGNVTILEFWATWADPCIEEFPKFKKLYSKFKDKGVQFLGISLDDDIEDLRGFVKQESVEWPQIFDGKRWKGKLPALYNVEMIPMIVVLDRENKVRYLGNEMENVSQIITALLSESKELPLFR